MSQARSVAKEFVKLSLAGREKDPLTNLRLQKLLYYAQAWSLVIRESELFSDEIEAWCDGPVVPEVHHALPDDGEARQLDSRVFDQEPDLEPEEAEFVRSVWEAYNQFSALMLSRMTHQERPWRAAWGDRPMDGTGNDPIQVGDLESYFSQQAVPAPLAILSHELRKREEEATRKLAGIPPLDGAQLAAVSTSVTPSTEKLRVSGV